MRMRSHSVILICYACLCPVLWAHDQCSVAYGMIAITLFMVVRKILTLHRESFHIVRIIIKCVQHLYHYCTHADSGHEIHRLPFHTSELGNKSNAKTNGVYVYRIDTEQINNGMLYMYVHVYNLYTCATACIYAYVCIQCLDIR